MRYNGYNFGNWSFIFINKSFIYKMRNTPIGKFVNSERVIKVRVKNIDPSKNV